MKRRDYIELALAYFEGDNEQKDQLKAIATVAQIKEKLKAYEEAIKLKKSIDKIRKDIGHLGYVNTRLNAFVELERMER